jgi:hypothetical protein
MVLEFHSSVLSNTSSNLPSRICQIKGGLIINHLIAIIGPRSKKTTFRWQFHNTLMQGNYASGLERLDADMDKNVDKDVDAGPYNIRDF